MSALTDAEINKGAAFLAKLAKQYESATVQIEKEIAAWYQRFADENGISFADASRILNAKELQRFRMSLDEFKEKAKSGNPQWQKQLDEAYIRTRISRLDSMKIQLQNVAESVSMDLQNGFENVASAIYTDTYYRTAYETQRGVGVGYSFARVDETKVEKLLSIPWASDGKNFSDRIWANKTQLISELQTTFTRDIITGASPSKTIDDLSKRMNVSKSNAARLVMTESAFFASAATKDSFNALGVEQYEISATLDSHTSAICQSLDGQVFPMNKYKEGETAPPFHVNCRSTTIPYFDDEFTKDETRASRDENDEGYIPIPASMNYQRWHKIFVESNEQNIFFRRDKDANGNEIIENHLYKKLTKDFIAHKGIIIRGEIAEEHLKKQNASASYFWGANCAMIKDNATVSDVLEEMYHAYQDRTNMFANEDKNITYYQREIDAQKHLLKCAKRYKISDKEILVTKENLVKYEKELEEYLQRDG